MLLVLRMYPGQQRESADKWTCTHTHTQSTDQIGQHRSTWPPVYRIPSWLWAVVEKSAVCLQTFYTSVSSPSRTKPYPCNSPLPPLSHWQSTSPTHTKEWMTNGSDISQILLHVTLEPSEILMMGITEKSVLWSNKAWQMVRTIAYWRFIYEGPGEWINRFNFANLVFPKFNII